MRVRVQARGLVELLIGSLVSDWRLFHFCIYRLFFSICLKCCPRLRGLIKVFLCASPFHPAEYKIKGGAIFHKCYACGAKEMVDMSHKLCTYIVNTAKKAKKSQDKEKASKDKKREKKVG